MPIDNMPEISGAPTPDSDIQPLSIPTYDTSASVPKSNIDTPQASTTAQLFGDFTKNLKPASLEQKDTPVYFDWAKSGLDRFQNSEYFGEKGFNPLRDFESNPQNTNEAQYGYRQTVWDTIQQAFGGAIGLGTQTFVQGFKDYGRIVSAITHWDADKLAPTAEEMQSLYNDQNDTFNK